MILKYKRRDLDDTEGDRDDGDDAAQHNEPSCVHTSGPLIQNIPTRNIQPERSGEK